MKKTFPRLFKLSDRKIEELWQNAVFVFDANVLLNLYRYPEKTFLEI